MLARIQQNRNPYIQLVGMQIITTVWRLLKKLKIELSYDYRIVLLGIYLKEHVRIKQRHLQANVYCGTIHNNGAMETIQVPYN
jgi:hypothetical protein